MRSCEGTQHPEVPTQPNYHTIWDPGMWTQECNSEHSRNNSEHWVPRQTLFLLFHGSQNNSQNTRYGRVYLWSQHCGGRGKRTFKFIVSLGLHSKILYLRSQNKQNTTKHPEKLIHQQTDRLNDLLFEFRFSFYTGRNSLEDTKSFLQE